MTEKLPDIKIAQLRNFALVAELKSFHAAAERSFRTQPAISLSIKELENKLGGALFEKGNNAELTPLGQYFYPLAKELLTQYECTIRSATLMTDKQSGQVSVAVVPSIASNILPAIIQQFVAAYPKVHIHVQDDNAQNVQEKVLNGSVDFGIASLWEADPKLAFTGLCKDRVGLVCHRNHSLAQEDEIRWEMLEGVQLIRNGTARLLENTAAASVVAGSQFFISNITSLVALLQANVGVTTLPYLAFPRQYADLCFRPLADPVIERQIGLVQRHKVTLSPAAEAMRQMVLNYFQNHPAAYPADRGYE